MTDLPTPEPITDTPSTVQPGDGGTMTPEWVNGLPEELAGHVAKNGYRDLAAVIKADMHAQSLLGKERLPLPSTDEDLDAWPGWSALGVPENPDGYALARPDLPEGMPYDEAFQTAMVEAAHGLKLTPRQAQGLLDAFAEYQGAAFSGSQAEVDREQTALETRLRETWAETFDTNLDQARRAMRALAPDPQALDALEGAMGDVRLVEFFHRLGGMLSEDSLAGHGDGTGGMPGDIARLEARIAGLLGQDDAGSRRERALLEDQRRSLLARAYQES